MEKNDLNKIYWENRYKTQETGWDTGKITPPLKDYIDQITNKELKILIPGCGRAYEAEYLFHLGFKQVFPAEFSPSAKKEFFERVPDFPQENWLSDDFFHLQPSFDLIVEQTFFCALHPNQRVDYVKKMHELLNPKGKLIGLLFCFPQESETPPFGGSKEEYTQLFSPYFEIEVMEKAYNSIEPRKGNELFIIMRKKEL